MNKLRNNACMKLFCFISAHNEDDCVVCYTSKEQLKHLACYRNEQDKERRHSDETTGNNKDGDKNKTVREISVDKKASIEVIILKETTNWHLHWSSLCNILTLDQAVTSIKRCTRVNKQKNSETGASGRRYRNITLTCGCGWIQCRCVRPQEAGGCQTIT